MAGSRPTKAGPYIPCLIACTHMIYFQALTTSGPIDVCPLQALGSTLSQIRNRPVDVVLYLSRLDEFRVDASDVQARILVTCFLHDDVCTLGKSPLYVHDSPPETEVPSSN